MRIKTNRPVYSYAEGDKSEFIKKFGEKFKEWKDSGKLKQVGATLGQVGQSGIFQGLFKGRRNKQQQPMPQQPMPPIPQPQPEKQGMSQTTKILIGVGAGVLILGLVYFASKKNTTIVTQTK